MKRAPRAKMMAHAALGFRAHSGWAAVVVVAGASRSPAVIDRRRIELADHGIPGSKQPYHAAAELDPKDAGKLVSRCAAQTRLLARRAVRALIVELGKKGHGVVGCGILLGSGRPATTLAATLASHALIHTAEGELFRNAIIQAGKRCDLSVTGVKQRELFARAAAEFRISVDELRARVVALGRSIGPPWTQDEKYAALVGWLALAAAGKR